jgi:pyruvate carboxylase
MGAHFLAIKDMAGLCRPYAASALVKALKEEIGIPVHFHTHDTSGVNCAAILRAADAQVDVVDLALASMSGSTSQPNLNSIVAALQHTPRDTGLDLDALNEFSDYWEQVRTFYAPFDTAPKAGSAEVYLHEMPGGQYTNLKEQAASHGPRRALARDRADLSRGERSLRRHRQGHAVQQGRRRHGAVSSLRAASSRRMWSISRPARAGRRASSIC